MQRVRLGEEGLVWLACSFEPELTCVGVFGSTVRDVLS